MLGRKGPAHSLQQCINQYAGDGTPCTTECTTLQHSAPSGTEYSSKVHECHCAACSTRICCNVLNLSAQYDSQSLASHMHRNLVLSLDSPPALGPPLARRHTLTAPSIPCQSSFDLLFPRIPQSLLVACWKRNLKSSSNIEQNYLLPQSQACVSVTFKLRLRRNP